MEEYPSLKEIDSLTKKVADSISPFEEVVFMDVKAEQIVRKRKNCTTWECDAGNGKWLPIRVTDDGWELSK